MLAPDRLCDIALAAASAAGALALSGFRNQPAVSKKGPRDLVTEYDLACERLLREHLTRALPGACVVGEEGGGSAEGELVWYCDPIDGTVNYAHGHPFWSVSVGALDERGPVAGAVVAPALGLTWTGHRGGVALRCGSPCAVSRTEQLSEAFVAARLREEGAIFEVRLCGSAALDLCFVADGTYDAFWHSGLSPWDIVGGAAVVLAAGGRISAPDGGPCRYEEGRVLATNGRLHDAFVPLVT